MKKLTIALFLILSSLVNAQEKGLLFLNVFPENAIIRFNDTLLKSQQTYPLDTGNYTLKMWLPTREYVERTVNIKAGKKTHLLEVLTYSDDYKKYLGKKRLYYLDKILLRYIAPAVSSWYLYGSYSSLSDLNDKVKHDYDGAIAFQNNYENEVNQSLLETYKASYEEHKSSYDQNLEQYNKDKTKLIIIGSTLVIANSALIYLSYKLKKPVYQENVLLSTVTLNNYNNQIIPSVYFSYKFK